MLIKVDDIVEVVSGDERYDRARGKVLKVDHKTGKLVVEGVNRVYKHVRPSQKNPQGGRLSKEMPMQASNVQYVCTKCDGPVKLSTRYLKDGSKERYCRSCGTSIDQIAPARKSAAKS